MTWCSSSPAWPSRCQAVSYLLPDTLVSLTTHEGGTLAPDLLLREQGHQEVKDLPGRGGPQDLNPGGLAPGFVVFSLTRAKVIKAELRHLWSWVSVGSSLHIPGALAAAAWEPMVCRQLGTVEVTL